MLVDGRALATQVRTEVAKRVAARPEAAPRLAVLTCAPDFATQKYLALKKRTATSVGIGLSVIELPIEATTESVVQAVVVAAAQHDGVVVQLPLPPTIDKATVLGAIPPEKDPDGFSYPAPGSCLPPVVGAIAEIARAHGVSFIDKSAVVLGQGQLVGAPAAHWLRTQGAHVTVLTEADGDPRAALHPAQILVTGIGRPHFLTPDMVPPGVVVFDAGTSEEGGVLAGDVDPAVAETAALFTPVPGGIGPLTVALLLRNLLELVGQ